MGRKCVMPFWRGAVGSHRWGRRAVGSAEPEPGVVLRTARGPFEVRARHAAYVLVVFVCLGMPLVGASVAHAESSSVAGTFSGSRTYHGVTITWSGSVRYDKVIYSGSGGTIYGPTGGSASWSVSGSDEAGCTYSGSGGFQIVDGKVAGYQVDGTVHIFSNGQYAASLQTASTGPIAGYNSWLVTASCPDEAPYTERYGWGDWLDTSYAKPSPTLNGDIMSGSDSFNNPPYSFESWRWNLRLGSPPLRAYPGGPYTVLRGGSAVLDGSRSTPSGKITSYRWTFAPGPDCPKGIRLNPGALKLGMRTTVAALCSLRLTLTVSDGHQRASATTTLLVAARKLKKVPFSQDRRDRVRMPFEYGLTLAFGLNRSAQIWRSSGKDLNADDRWLDPGRDPNGTKKSVLITKLADPHGPFDGFWYVTGHNLKVDRVIVLNRMLLPGGDVYELNTGRRSYRAGIEAIVDATLQHELIHGQLADAALANAPLLRDLEKAIATRKSTLLDRTNLIIGTAETKLKNASSEQKVHARMRTIYKNQKVTIIVPTSGLDAPKSFLLAELGDVERR